MPQNTRTGAVGGEAKPTTKIRSLGCYCGPTKKYDRSYHTSYARRKRVDAKQFDIIQQNGSSRLGTARRQTDTADAAATSKELKKKKKRARVQSTERTRQAQAGRQLERNKRAPFFSPRPTTLPACLPACTAVALSWLYSEKHTRDGAAGEEEEEALVSKSMRQASSSSGVANDAAGPRLAFAPSAVKGYLLSRVSITYIEGVGKEAGGGDGQADVNRMRYGTASCRLLRLLHTVISSHREKSNGNLHQRLSHLGSIARKRHSRADKNNNQHQPSHPPTTKTNTTTAAKP